MCLYTRQICPIRARRDIEVYKVLRYDRATGGIITPYVNFPVLTKTIDVSEEPMEQGGYFTHTIAKGMVHSYNYLPTLEGCFYQTGFVVKAIIPKGTLYYRGFNNDCASKKLILKDIVKYATCNQVLNENIKRAYENLSESR